MGERSSSVDTCMFTHELDRLHTQASFSTESKVICKA